MIKKVLKNQKGLTLIELLAVIVILGIIAAIAVPAIGNVINKAEDDAVKADAMQAMDAAKLYLASNPNSNDTGLDQTELAEYYDGGTLTSFTVNVVDRKVVSITFTHDGTTYTGITLIQLQNNDLDNLDAAVPTT